MCGTRCSGRSCWELSLCKSGLASILRTIVRCVGRISWKSSNYCSSNFWCSILLENCVSRFSQEKKSNSKHRTEFVIGFEKLMFELYYISFGEGSPSRLVHSLALRVPSCFETPKGRIWGLVPQIGKLQHLGRAAAKYLRSREVFLCGGCMYLYLCVDWCPGSARALLWIGTFDFVLVSAFSKRPSRIGCCPAGVIAFLLVILVNWPGSKGSQVTNIITWYEKEEELFS